MPDEDETVLEAGADDDGTTESAGEGLWHSSLRQTLRLLPAPSPQDSVAVLLEADGLTEEQVLPRLRYEPQRRHDQSSPSALPDLKRVRDPRLVAQTVGLLFMDGGRKINVTALGTAVRRWMPDLTDSNWPVLGAHAAYALAVCQLRNPTRAGAKYPVGTQVFPYAYIWRAMLALDGKITSDELNRTLLRTRNETELEAAIDAIGRRRRDGGPLADLGIETVSGPRKNDRLIPWISLASFGWMFITDKDALGYYNLRPGASRLLGGPARGPLVQREFSSEAEYVTYMSDAACLPEDLR